MSVRDGKGISTSEIAQHLYGYAEFLDSEAAKAKALHRVLQGDITADSANELERRAKDVLDLANELYERNEIVGAIVSQVRRNESCERPKLAAFLDTAYSPPRVTLKIGMAEFALTLDYPGEPGAIEAQMASLSHAIEPFRVVAN